MKLDMHFHSLKSDGHLSEDELLKIAKQKGLDFVALTDHDLVSYGFRDRSKELGISSCESVEISARNYEHDKSLHLTFYAKYITKRINDVLNNTINSKRELIENQIKHLIKKGFVIDVDDFYKYSCKSGRKIDGLNKFDIVTYMFQNPKNIELAKSFNNGVEISIEEFFSRFLKESGDNYNEFGIRIQEYEPSIQQCRNFREEVNAILSIAHPNFTFKKGVEEFELVLPNYIKNGGVNAIEINSCATKDWVDAILKAKEKYGLYLTFGSDFHKFTHDNKHAELGDLNPFITQELVSDSFSEYGELLVK